MVLVLIAALLLGGAIPDDSTRTVEARSASAEIAVDARLDEPVWDRTSSAGSFTQFEPDPGAAPTFPTDVRVAYGPDALYVGARLYDDRPEQINATLSRRDELSQADRFQVSIDSYLDRETAFTFAVSAAGVQADWIMQDARGGVFSDRTDTSWDAVWYSETRITSEGWVVEMKIPYSMLRFSQAESMRWGIQFRRQIARFSEVDDWVYVPETEGEYVARFGLLTGLENIQPDRNVQVTPYTLSRLRSTPTADGELRYHRGADVGADLKVGLSSNVTLDATLNPDFGQVESDPAVLNLSTFETFFPEKRPFFLEGTQIFDFEFPYGDGSLLYTRRIGGSASPVIGALKLTGRSTGGTSYGLMGAATGAEFDPDRAYGAARLKQEFGSTSYLGGMLTGYARSASDRPRRKRALTGGADWNLRWSDQTFGTNGFATFSRVLDGRAEAVTGVGGNVEVARVRGPWQYSTSIRGYSPGFRINDAGRLRQNDFVRGDVGFQHWVNENEPFGPFRQASTGGFLWKTWTWEEWIDRGWGSILLTDAEFRNFHSVGANVGFRQVGGVDVRETRGLWPYENPGRYDVRLSYRSDSRKTYGIRPSLEYEVTGRGASTWSTALRGRWSVHSRLRIAGRVEHEREDDLVAWMANEPLLRTETGRWRGGPSNTDPGELARSEFDVPYPQPDRLDRALAEVAPAAGDDRFYVPLFGARDTRELNLRLRGNLVLFPRLTLQWFNQVFVARGRYENAAVLVEPSSLVGYRAYPKRHDFALRSYISNVVLRWEFRRGSTLFFVWNQNRRLDEENPLVDPTAPSPYTEATGELLRETFRVRPTNIYLLKLEYTFLRQ